MKKKKSVKKKRTLSLEHLAKMQEGRRRAKKNRERSQDLKNKGLDFDVKKSKYETMLDKMRRK